MTDFRARTKSELLDAAFEIYRRHFTALATIAAVAFVPLALATFFAPPPTAAPRNIAVSPSFVIYVVLAITGVVLLTLVTAALVSAASDAYQRGDVDVARALRTGFARPWSVFNASLGASATITIGFILLIVPGVFFFIWYFAIPATVVLEDRTAGSAMKRSRELSRGNKGRIFLLLGLSWFFYFLISVFVAGFALVITKSTAAVAIARLLVGMVVFPVLPIIQTLLYYDIRIRKEGYDIEFLAGELTPPPTIAA